MSINHLNPPILTIIMIFMCFLFIKTLLGHSIVMLNVRIQKLIYLDF